LDDQTLTFGLEDDRIVDDLTGSEWDVLGRAVGGPLKGRQLAPVVSVNHFWFLTMMTDDVPVTLEQGRQLVMQRLDEDGSRLSPEQVADWAGEASSETWVDATTGSIISLSFHLVGVEKPSDLSNPDVLQSPELRMSVRAE
jgi:hypothetical protein